MQITKIDHHRGSVTGLQVSHISDVLVSSSLDANVCLWSLDDFTLLNTIQLNSPILNIQISSDSVSNEDDSANMFISVLIVLRYLE